MVPESEDKKVKEDLEHVQRMVFLGITGVMNSTPTKALETLMNILLVDLYSECEALITATRLKNAECWKSQLFCYSVILTEKAKEIPELLMRADKCSPHYLFGKGYEVVVPHRDFWQDEKSVNEVDLNVFTDGSKMGNCSGFGVYSEKGLRLSYAGCQDIAASLVTKKPMS